MQVLVLSHLQLQQAKEIKSQSNDIRCLSTLLEKQQAILEKVPRAAEEGARNACSFNNMHRGTSERGL